MGYKVLDIDIGYALMDLSYDKTWHFLEKWKDFMKNSGKETLKRDLWDMFYTLNKETSGDWKNFVDDGTWPGDIDEFADLMA